MLGWDGYRAVLLIRSAFSRPDAVAQEEQASRQNLGSGSRLSSSRPGGSSSRKEVDDYDDEDDDRGGGYGGEAIVDDEEDDYE